MDFPLLVMTALASWLLALAATPLMMWAARKVNAIDEPDGNRKHQAQAVPLGGGLAVVGAASVALALVLGFAKQAPSVETSLWAGLLPAAAILLTVGVIDDFIGLTGIYKLIGQMLAATVLAAGGAQFDVLSLAGGEFDLGSLALPFSVFFILGAINAFNLIDGSDGLAGSVGAVVLVTLGAISGMRGDATVALVSFAMAGGLLGFLRYNWAPARIYLGDTGSMFIGLVVAYVATESSIKQQAATALIVPLAGCAIPIMDVAAALVRRVTTGQSMFAPDRGHFHHALMLRGLSVRQTALVAAGLTAITCLGAVASYQLRQDWPALATILLVVVGLASLRVFGHAEARLVATHARSGWAGLWRRMRRNAVVDPQTNHAVDIQGSRVWRDLWAALRESAPKHGVCGLRLNINIPRIHESFYGNWKLREEPGAAPEDRWQLTLPLWHREESIGRLTILGGLSEGSRDFDPEPLSLFLEPMQDEIERILGVLGGIDSSNRSTMPLGAADAAVCVAKQSKLPETVST